jgi:hypothetical protein
MQFLKFWGGAFWESLTIGWVVFGIVSTATPALFTLVVRYWPKAAQITWVKWAADHQSELHVAIASLCILIYLIYVPYRLFNREHQARVAAEQKIAAGQNPDSRIRLDVADTDARKELAETKDKLDQAYKTIQKLDPLRQPIASGSFMVNMVVKYDKQMNTHFFGPGGEIGFGRGDKPLLTIGVGDAFANTIQNQQVSFRVLSNSQISGPLAGKPMTELIAAEYVQIELKVLPENIEVLSGTMEVTLNGTQRFEFDIPQQKARGNKVFVQDLAPMKSKLIIMPPLPTPDKGASPP